MYVSNLERMGKRGAPRRMSTSSRRGKSSAAGRMLTLERKRARALKGMGA